MRVVVYVDGFNLYYGLTGAIAAGVLPARAKWLDLHALARRICPGDEIARVKYFTARVRSQADDPAQTARQAVYWQALAANPRVRIVEGSFRFRPVWRPTVDSFQAVEREARHGTPISRLRYEHVMDPEEKGSDVNLAVHLLHDAHRGAFEQAVVISNDQDILTAIRLVRLCMGLPVVVCNGRSILPRAEKPKAQYLPTRQLREAATLALPVRASDILGSILPSPVVHPVTGNVCAKPEAWT